MATQRDDMAVPRVADPGPDDDRIVLDDPAAADDPDAVAADDRDPDAEPVAADDPAVGGYRATADGRLLTGEPPVTKEPVTEEPVAVQEPVAVPKLAADEEPLAADEEPLAADEDPLTGDEPAAVTGTGTGAALTGDRPDTTPAAALAEQQWPAIQSMFVDNPRGAVERAAAAAGEVAASLVATLEREQAELRASWQRDVDTEGLRTALQRYRAFCGRLEGLT